jgi:hypothetical protein
MDRLSHRDFWTARKAHRTFCADPIDAPCLKRRRAYRWTRVSPDEACKRGRIDMLDFPYRRSRVPATFDLWCHVMRTGDDALLEFASARNVPIQRHGVIDDGAKRGHANAVVAACRIVDDEGLTMRTFEVACLHGRDDTTLSIWDRVHSERADARRVNWAARAAGAGRVEVVRRLIQPHMPPAGLILAESARCRSSDVLRFLDDDLGWLDGNRCSARDWDCAFCEAATY